MTAVFAAEHKYAIVRDALLDAALRCFAERGVLETRIEDVRRAAGASPSSVYHQFDGLPGLTTALLTRTFDRLLGHLSARVVETTSAEAAVHALVDGHIEWVVDHSDEARFMYQAMALELGRDEDGTLAAAKAELKTPIFAHFERFADELPPWPPHVLELVLLGPSNEACCRYLGGAKLDPEWMRSTLPEPAWRSVATAPAAASRPRAGRRPR